MDKKPFLQVGESVEADFEQFTWTFRFPSTYRVCAGNFAIVPIEDYSAMSDKLANAQGLLRRVLAGDVSVELREHIESHFDPDPL